MRREIPSQRAFLPSDLGDEPPQARSDTEDLCCEKHDPRRGNTDYIQALEAEIERRRRAGTLIEVAIDSGDSPCYHRSLSERRNIVSSTVMEKPKKVEKPKRKAKAKKIREQTCVNLFVPIKVALDRKCKKVGRSRNRIINEIVARFVGIKLEPKKLKAG